MMHLAYRHARPTYAVSGGTLVTDAAAWSDRSPQSVARLTWPPGAQTTATTCTITGSFAEQPVRCVALLNTTLPAGLKIKLHGKRASDTGYTYALGGAALTHTLVQRIDGGTGAVWVLPAGNDPLVGVEIRAYNDAGGAVAIAASATIDIGEIVISDGLDFLIESDWHMTGKDPSSIARTLGSQTARVQRTPYRVLTATPAYVDDDDARNSGLPNGSDWQAIAHALRTDPYVLAVARTGTAGDTQTTSIYGLATRVPNITHRAGPLYQPGELEVEEIPG